MNTRSASSLDADRTGRPAVEVPDVPAHVLHFVSTKNVPYDVVAARCPWCHANHRHVTTGLRLASCGRGVYRLIVAGGA